MMTDDVNDNDNVNVNVNENENENENQNDVSVSSSSSASQVSQVSQASTPTLGGALLCCAPCLEMFEKPRQDDYTNSNSNNNSNTNSNTNSNKKEMAKIQVPIMQGDAFDIIVVQAEDGTLHQNSEFLVSFPSTPPPNHKIILEVQGGASNSDPNNPNNPNNQTNTNTDTNTTTTTAWFPIIRVSGSKRDKNKTKRKIKNKSKTKNSKNDTSCRSRKSTRTRTSTSTSISIRAHDNQNGESDASSSPPTPSSWGCCHPSAMPGKISDLNGSIDDLDIDIITSKLAPLLKPGKNPFRYLLLDDQETATVIGVAHASIFLWSYDDSIVVSDIDGTITKSNARGVIDTILTENYRYCHSGISKLLSDLATTTTTTTTTHQTNQNTQNQDTQKKNATEKNTHILYVTSRPIGLAAYTRKFLENLRQGVERLPEGPVLGFGGTIPQLLVMELVSRRTHHFKAEMLWNQVVQPFRQANTRSMNMNMSLDMNMEMNMKMEMNMNMNIDTHSATTAESSSPIFLAGFGNTLMDVQAYHMAGMDLGNIYLINKKSVISVFNKTDDDEEEEEEEDDININIDQERTNLTSTVNSSSRSSATQNNNNSSSNNNNNNNNLGVLASTTTTMGVAMPRRWYQSQKGCTFQGYSDSNLLSRLLTAAEQPKQKIPNNKRQ